MHSPSAVVCLHTVPVSKAHLLDVLLHLRDVICNRPVAPMSCSQCRAGHCMFVCWVRGVSEAECQQRHALSHFQLFGGCAPQQEHRLQQRGEVRSARARTRWHQPTLGDTVKICMMHMAGAHVTHQVASDLCSPAAALAVLLMEATAAARAHRSSAAIASNPAATSGIEMRASTRSMASLCAAAHTAAAASSSPWAQISHQPLSCKCIIA